MPCILREVIFKYKCIFSHFVQVRKCTHNIIILVVLPVPLRMMIVTSKILGVSDLNADLISGTGISTHYILDLIILIIIGDGY